MEWLAQCVSYVKETLPPGSLAPPIRNSHSISNRRQKNASASTFVSHENGKRRKVQQERSSPLQRSPNTYKFAASSTTTEESTARPPPNAWFHPSHPLREDPRVTARRYNSGYDLDTDEDDRKRTTVSVKQSSTPMTMMGEPAESEEGKSGRRLIKLTGKGLVEKPSLLASSVPPHERVNYDKVLFAEQVLQPVYHSPYPEIKLETDWGANSTTTCVSSSLSSARRAGHAKSRPRTMTSSRSRGESARNGRNDGRSPRRRNASRENAAAAARGDLAHPNGARNGTMSSVLASEDGVEVPLADTRNGGVTSTEDFAGHHFREKRWRSREFSVSDEEEGDEEEEEGGGEEEKEQQEEKDDDYTPPEEVTNSRNPTRPTMTSTFAPSTASASARGYARLPLADEQDLSQSGSSIPTPLAPAQIANLPANGAARHHPSPSRSLWVCDKCFKYMPAQSAYVAHTKACTVNFPPGRKVYEKANWGIWEIDGKEDKLYCQNLSLFGKLFIDHKSICFDVESFYYYVLTDSSPKRDHVIAYFTKEKFSIDDFNLATILVFPHVQQSGFGRLLMEFSYHLTKDSASPGTPERPLSLLGARSYESLWMAMLVRHLIKRLFEQGNHEPKGRKIKKVDTYMRVWERRKRTVQQAIDTDDYLNYNDLRATQEELERQEEQVPLTITMTVEELARECNLKTDDLFCLLSALGVLGHRRLARPLSPSLTGNNSVVAESSVGPATQALARQLGLQDWSRTRVAIDFELIVKIIGTWRIPAKPLLDPQCCWITYTGGPLSKPVARKNYVGYF